VRRGGDDIKCLVNAGEREREVVIWDQMWRSGVLKRVGFHFKGEFKNYSLIRVV
jgi:hypothetical protein